VKTWVEISSKRLTANYNSLQHAAGPATILAVVKANAYGHSVELCAPILARLGAPWLGVADAAEGASIRKVLAAAGAPQPRILTMSALFAEDVPTILEQNLTPVVWLPQHIDWLTAANKTDTPIPIHIELDTGMSRQGVPPGPELNALLASLKTNTKLNVEGILTHFGSSEIPHSTHTQTQRERFEKAMISFKAAGISPTLIHAGSSSTLDVQDESFVWLTNLTATFNAQPMIRTGIALYGYCLPTTEPKLKRELQPVLTWKTRILALRDIVAGDTVGYNATYTAAQPMRLALLPIGYSDGLRRELSSTNILPGGWAIIRGRKAPIIGRISMNLTTVDVTQIPDAAYDDEVTILGDNITADDQAKLANTISYEILCAIRAPRRLGN
jgi:alanine racemase